MFNIDVMTNDRDEDGVWTEYEGSKFRIAHINNPKFQTLFTKLQIPYKRQIDKGTLDPDTQLTLMCKALSQCVLTDWTNVVDTEDATIPYSQDVAFKVLMNNAEFRDYVQDFALDVSNFRREVISEVGKSLKSISSGN